MPPALTNVLYKNNYLTQVILRLDFASVPALLAENQPIFRERVQDRFPCLQRTQHMQFSINLNTGSQPAAVPTPVSWLWRFGADDQFKRVIALSNSLLTLEYGAGQYTSSKDFIDTFLFAYRTFMELYKVDVINRVGWRYINDIKIQSGNPFDWKGFIKDDLVAGVMAAKPESMQMTRSMHQLAAVEDDINLVLNYGIQNPEFPNPVAKKTFVIDQDFSIKGGIRSDELPTRLADLNQRAEKLFESVIDDNLRDLMGKTE